MRNARVYAEWFAIVALATAVVAIVHVTPATYDAAILFWLVIINANLASM